MKKELSVFIDESGDFGGYDPRAPYYIIGMVFHEQSQDLSHNFSELDASLRIIGFYDRPIHSGPIIRREDVFKNMNYQERNRILRRLVSFSVKSGCLNKSFYVDKRGIRDSVELTDKLAKQIAFFFRDRYDYFLEFDSIKIYYDNGQKEVGKIITFIFSSFFSNAEIKYVSPDDYRLFQLADLVCTAKLLQLKMQTNQLSKSEDSFFGSKRELKKRLLKPISKNEME